MVTYRDTPNQGWEMEADIYLVFNQDGILIRTRLVTRFEALYRSVDLATSIANQSKTLIDLGSIEPSTVYSTRPILETLASFDDYQGWYSIRITTIII